VDRGIVDHSHSRSHSSDYFSHIRYSSPGAIRVRIRSILPLVAVTLSVGRASAQNSPQMSPAAAIPQWRSFFGANPLGIPFDIVSVEAETAVGTAATIGGVASYNDFDNKRYTTVDARFKYYPGEVALRGFSVGSSFGYTKFRGGSVTSYDSFGNPITTADKSLNAGTLGVFVDYNWAQGPSQRFVVGTGVGAKRILASAPKRDPLGLERAYITGRFVIGLMF
jgi:hypothetical protein